MATVKLQVYKPKKSLKNTASYTFCKQKTTKSCVNLLTFCPVRFIIAHWAIFIQAHEIQAFTEIFQQSVLYFTQRLTNQYYQAKLHQRKIDW